jgi:adenylate cyclase
MDSFTLSVLRNGRTIFQHEFHEPLLIGRQDPNRQDPNPTEAGGQPCLVEAGKPAVPQSAADAGCARLIVADINDRAISRSALFVQPTAGGIYVENRNLKQLPLQTNLWPLPPGERKFFQGELRIDLPGMVVLLQHSSETESPIQSLAMETLAPGRTKLRAAPTGSSPAVTPPESWSTSGRALLDWLNTTIGVLEDVASGGDFVARSVEAALSLVRLDASIVMDRTGDVWQERARAAASGFRGTPISQSLLNRAAHDRRAVWKQPGNSAAAGTLDVFDTAIAAPILNTRGQVIGALYGQRRARSVEDQLRTEDALLFDLLARIIAAGLASLEIGTLRNRFEQFFSPALAHRLLDDPELLESKDADVTVMFCDIRGFSRISAKLPPKTLTAWAGACLDLIASQVLEHRGVIVDYIGDEVLALWGAPEPQTDHAEQACRAATAIQQALSEFNSAWRERIQDTTAVGIGIHSGPAQVGNTGSQQRFKYGPLGHTVNLASRVQGVTKQLQTPILITRDTQGQLRGDWLLRRIGLVQAVNIPDSTELFQLTRREDSPPGWREAVASYEQGLSLFEAGQFGVALERLLGILQRYPHDGPTLALIERAVGQIRNPSPEFNSVWKLTSK